MSVHVYLGNNYKTGHERGAFGEFLQDMVTRYGETEVPYYVIGEVQANEAFIDMLLISPGALIIAEIKELKAAIKEEANQIRLVGKQNGPWEYTLPGGRKEFLGGKGNVDNPYIQLFGYRHEFANWLEKYSENLFGENLSHNRILDHLFAWCIISPGFDGNLKSIDLPWDNIRQYRDWFKVFDLENLPWKFNCASNTLLKFSEAQILELISYLGVTERKNWAELIPVPPPTRDPFFSKPHLSVNLIDRLEEREKLCRFLQDEGTSVISLHGLGGVGKTELAAWLSQNAREMDYDVRWIDCLEKEVTDESFLAAIASEIPNRWDAELILSRKSSMPDRMEAALNYLAKKHTLIILNDFHKVAQKESLDPLLTHIVQHYKQIKVILTTREYPSCIDNARWRPGAAREIPIVGLPQDSVKEFINLDTSLNISQDWEKIVFDRTSGNPYALRLVSALVRRYGLGEEVNSLPLFNAAQSRECKEWFNSLLATVSEDARRLADRISVVRTDLTQGLINSLWHEPKKAYELTRELVNEGILQPSEDANTFFLHEFIREFLYDRLTDDRRKKSHEDASNYYLKMSKETIDDNLTAEYLIEALFHMNRVPGSKDIQQHADICYELMIKKGDRERAQTVAFQGLKAARENKEEEDTARWLIRIADREIEYDKFREGGKRLDEAIKILSKITVKTTSQKINDLNKRMAHAYLLKGRLGYLISEFSSARENFDKALTLSREANDQHEQIYCMVMMGHLARQKKDYNGAYQWWQQASDLATTIHDTVLENECFSVLGLMSRRRGDFEDAKRRFTQVYENAKKQGNRRVEETNLNLLGDLYMRSGEYEKAEPLFRQGLEIAKTYGIGQGIRICMGQLAEALIYLGEYEEAKQFLLEVEQRCEQAQDGIGMAWTLRRKGQLLQRLGNKDQGDELILTGIQKLREMGNEDYIADFEKVLSSNQ